MVPGDKAAWRKVLLSTRKALSIEDVRSRSAVICERAWGFVATLEPGFAACYRPIHNEVDPLVLERKLKKRGWTMLYPNIEGANMTFATDDGKVVHHHLITLWIIPLIGVDGAKRRLGFGGGHYDRLWGVLDKNRKRFSVGLAYDFQKVEFGSQQHDWVLDSVASDD